MHSSPEDASPEDQPEAQPGLGVGSGDAGRASDAVAPDWEAFYRDYRKPGYIDGFEITTKLGGGMFGFVFRARRMSIGKDYAIKFLKVDDGDVRRAVLSELEQVKYFAQIDHPNLVSIEDRGEVNGIPYLVMAFAGTETLRSKMEEVGIGDGKELSPSQKGELLRAFLQTARGLHALHERSLVHFDIKPANVFIKGGVARLGDYGLSKLVTHSRGSLSMGRGTPYYMAPEMLQRRGDVRSDVYSLGVMLYEILCGKLPFTGDSEWEVLRRHEKEPPELPAHLTAVERAVISKSLAKDPEGRYQSVAEMLAAFGPLSQLDAMPAAGDGPPQADLRATTLPPPPAKSSPLPPPLPPAAAKPSASAAAPVRKRSREMARRDRRSRVKFGFVGILVAVLLVVFAMMGLRNAMIRDEIRSKWDNVAMHDEIARSLQKEVRLQGADIASALGEAKRYAYEALARGRSDAARNTPSPLRSIQDRGVGVESLEPYLEVLMPVAESPKYVPALAVRAKQYGRHSLLAAASMLQKFNYRDGLDCHRATNLQRMLAEMTGLTDMVVEMSGRDPSPREVCMFHAVAGGWRQIAERFAASDQAYRKLSTASAATPEPPRPRRSRKK